MDNTHKANKKTKSKTNKKQQQSEAKKQQNLYFKINHTNEQSQQDQYADDDDDDAWQDINNNQSSSQEDQQNQRLDKSISKSTNTTYRSVDRKSKNKKLQKNENNNTKEKSQIKKSPNKLRQKFKQQLSFQVQKDSKQQQNDFELLHRIRLNRQLNIVIWAFIVTICVLLISHYYLRKLQEQHAFVKEDVQNPKNFQLLSTNYENFAAPNQNKNKEKNIQQQFMTQNAQQQISELSNQIADPKQKEQSLPDLKQPLQNIKKEDKLPQFKPAPPQPRSFSLPKTAQTTQFPKYRTPPPPPNQKYSQTLNLKDFENQTVYIEAPQQIKSIFDRMIRRPAQKKGRPTSVFMPSQKAYFAYRLFKQPQNQQYMKAELYYYETKYRISMYEEQIQLCIVAPGRNIVANGRFKRFIDSIQRQNYSNYRLVYIDDFSDDQSPEHFQSYVKSTQGYLSKLSGAKEVYEGSFIVQEQSYKIEQDPRRLIIVKNNERVYALANRNKGIREYCPEHSVILDVDADDAIIGRQAFKFINSVYHDPEVWMFNSVFIYDKSAQRQVTTGPQLGIPQGLLQNNQYRTGMIWRTSQLRTFKAQLFNKINEDDFKNQFGVFYQWASDVFVQMPLVQLAGPKHYKHLYEILYFYDWDFNRTTVYKRRHFRDIVYMQTPYQPLAFLEDEAKKVQNYQVPSRIKIEYDKNIQQAIAQAVRYGRKQTF